MFEILPAHTGNLGELQIFRALPRSARRMIGAWCFLDRYGPLTFREGRPMDVAPHPHIGIQTVSWLLDGEVLHQDSLGIEATVRPGGVNVMTSGRGIAHAEQTPEMNRGRLDGVQLWVALPDRDRHVEPSFDHVADVPRLELSHGHARVFLGSLGDATSPAPRYSEIVGADIEVRGALELPTVRDFEHGLFVLSGSAELEGQRLEPNTLYYLGTDRSSIAVRGDARVLLLGGRPFGERVFMWWNFVARTADEIADARREWEAEGARFGDVRAYRGARIPAPSLGRIAPPNPAS